jgi:hypothetical protein
MIEVLGETAVIKDGFLTKEGFNLRNWKKRWFVLYPDRLIYKATPDGPKELGKIPLQNVLGIEKDPFEKHKNLHTFNIMTVNRRYVIQCQDAKEQNQWVAALQTTLKRQNLVFPYIHIAVGKKNLRGKFQQRILQFDFLHKRINNLNGDNVKKMHPFANLLSTKEDAKDKKRVIINFKNQSKTEYNIFTVIPDHVGLIAMIVNHILKGSSISDLYSKISGLLEKSGFAFEKIKPKRSGSVFGRATKAAETSIKRWLLLQAGQLVVYNGNCDGYPLYCESLHECTISSSQETKEEMIVAKKDGTMRRFEFSSVNECEEWVKLTRRFSIERSNDQFFQEVVTLQRSDSVLSFHQLQSIVVEDEAEAASPVYQESHSPSSSSLALHKSSARKRTMSYKATMRSSNADTGSSGSARGSRAGSFVFSASPKNPDSFPAVRHEDEEEDAQEEEFDEDEEEDEDNEEMPMITSSTTDLGLDNSLESSTTKKFEVLQGVHNVQRVMVKADLQAREARLAIDLTAFEWKTPLAAAYEKILLVDIIDVFAGYPGRVTGVASTTATESTDQPCAFSIITHQCIEIVVCDSEQIRDLFVEVLASLALY